MWAVGIRDQDLTTAQIQAGKRGASCEPGAELWAGREPLSQRGLGASSCSCSVLRARQESDPQQQLFMPRKASSDSLLKAGDTVQARLTSSPAGNGQRCLGQALSTSNPQGDLDPGQFSCLEMSGLFVMKGISRALVSGGIC